MDKRITQLSIAFSVLIVFAAILDVSHDPREQTGFLERFAKKLERSQTVHSDTEQYVRILIASIRHEPCADPRMRERQTVAINRIEIMLSDHTPALRRDGASLMAPRAAAE